MDLWMYRYMHGWMYRCVFVWMDSVYVRIDGRVPLSLAIKPSPFNPHPSMHPKQAHGQKRPKNSSDLWPEYRSGTQGVSVQVPQG